MIETSMALGQSERLALLGEVTVAQHAVIRAIWSSAQPAWRQLDLSLGQLKALMIVAQEECIGIGSLGECVGLGRSRTSEMVSQLVRRNLVTRSDNPIDRRCGLVRLTHEGTMLVEDLFPTGQRIVPGLAERLADPELVRLADGLRALAGALERMLTGA